VLKSADNPARKLTIKRVFMRLVLVLVLLLIIICAWLSVRQGLADNTADDAWQDMLTWQAETIEFDQVQQAYATMLNANQLAHNHPTYLHRLGRLSHLLMTMELAKRSYWGGLAKDYYRQSLAIRPAWPQSWASLALVKADLLEFDAELDQSLVNATVYGPYEPAVLEIVAGIGLQHERFLTPTVLEVVYGNIARGLTSPSGGTARNIFALLANQPLSAGLIPHLEARLLANDWAKHTDLWVRLALSHWEQWSTAGRQRIRITLNDKLVDNPGRMRMVRETDQLLDICPYLPRKPKLMSACKSFD